MIRRTLAAGALLMAALAPGASASTGTLTGTPFGAVDFGDLVAYRVAGDGCESPRPQVVVTVGGTEVLGPESRPWIDGTDTSGCTGAATVPSFSDVRAAG